MVQLVVILDDIRSSANVGSILRTCDATGIERVLACGITPYPELADDPRDPVVINRNSREIAKAALGAERTVKVEYHKDSIAAIAACRAEGRTIFGLEQTPGAVNLMTAELKLPAALVVGNEVDGVSEAALELCDSVVQIPQLGHKESLNVAVAVGVALYRFVS